MGRGASTGDDGQRLRAGRTWHAESVHDSCRVIDAGPLALEDLPADLREDADLADNLARRFGLQELENLRFRLVEVPLSALEEFRLDAPIEQFFSRMIAADEEWTDAWDADRVPDHDFQDGEARRDITRHYLEAFQAGVEVTPIVLDLFAIEGQADVLDGHHRLAAAHEASVGSIRGYELMPAEG